MKDGTTVQIRLFEDGYVQYAGWTSRIVLKLDSKAFQKLFQEAVIENYVYKAGK